MVAFRTRLRRSAVALVLALLTVFSLLIYTGLAALLARHVDRELLTLAEQEAARIELTTGALTSPDDDEKDEIREAARAAVVLSPSGTVLWKGAASAARPPLSAAQLAGLQHGRPLYDTVTPPHDGSIRRISFPVAHAGSVRYLLQLETPLRLVDDTLRLLLLLLAALAGAMLVAGWIGSRWLAREALTPVDALTATAEQISAPSLRTRMTLAAPYEEFDRLARVFNAMLDRLHHVFEGQRRFIADAAHEIQTPLTVMKGTIEVALQKSRTADDYRDALVTNLGQVERLGTLTRSLLTLAQFSGDRPPVALTPLALEPLVRDLIKELSPLAEDRKIQLISDLLPVPFVQGDAGRLTQLLINLLDNALAYTPPDGRITIRLKPLPPHVVLQVEDTGTGIAPEHLPRLFERFYRADPARARESGGTGLGLAIVKEIAEAHGGTVVVESTPGHGTRFTVTLPACAAGDVSSDR
ncbi:MAG: HAMP domain-containing protein [Nitrospira sp.]|nr:HAMP domain-containing protein [Nitrospira sp.]